MYHLGAADATEDPELSLLTRNITQGNVTFSSPNVHHKLFFNPAVQSIYLPESDWTKMMDVFVKNYSSNYFICDDYLGQCYFPLTCDGLKHTIGVDFADINIQLENGEITIKWSNLFIEGKYIDPMAQGDRCYIAIIKSDILEPGVW